MRATARTNPLSNSITFVLLTRQPALLKMLKMHLASLGAGGKSRRETGK